MDAPECRCDVTRRESYSPLQLPLGYQYHDQVGREGGQRRAARHPDVAVLEEHAVEHVDHAVGALDVRTEDPDPLAVPLDLVAWKESNRR